MACSCCYESAFTTPSPTTQPDICNSDIGAIVVTSDNAVYVRINQSSPCTDSDFVEIDSASFTINSDNTCNAGGIGNGFAIASTNLAGGVLTLNGQPEHNSFHTTDSRTTEVGLIQLPTTVGGSSNVFSPFDTDIGAISACRFMHSTAIVNGGVLRVNANQNTIVDYTLQVREVVNGVPLGWMNTHRVMFSHAINGTLRYPMPSWNNSIINNPLITTSWYLEARLTREGGGLILNGVWENPQLTHIYTTEE